MENKTINEATKIAKGINDSNNKKNKRKGNKNFGKSFKRIIITIFIALISVFVTYIFNNNVPQHSPFEKPELQFLGEIKTFICSANGKENLLFTPIEKRKDAFLSFQIYNPNKEDYLDIFSIVLKKKRFTDLENLKYIAYSGKGGDDNFIRGYTMLGKNISESKAILLNKETFLEFDREYTLDAKTDPSNYKKIDYVKIGPGDKDTFLIILSAEESGMYDVEVEVHYIIGRREGYLNSEEKTFIAGTPEEMKNAGFPSHWVK